MGTAHSLAAYSTANFGGGGAGFSLRGVNVEIQKAENGYIFKLEGSKEVQVKQKNDDYFDRWESFNATFVYEDLDDGLSEVKNFFALIQKELDKKVAAQTKRNKKKK